MLVFLFQMTSANPEQFGAAMGNAAEYAQEEEWEREGLLDPAWEKQQRKVRHKHISDFLASTQYPCFYFNIRLMTLIAFLCSMKQGIKYQGG